MPADLQLVHPEAQKQRALVAFLRDANVAAACAAAGISRTTWYNWVAEDPVFATLLAALHEVWK